MYICFRQFTLTMNVCVPRKVLPHQNINNAEISFRLSENNLGFTLDRHFLMNKHVSTISRTCYFELRRLCSSSNLAHSKVS